MDPITPQTLEQKKMAFAGSEHVAIAILLFKECGGVSKLLGDSEFETVVNAATLDAQQDMITKFISSIDNIKKGSLHQSK